MNVRARGGHKHPRSQPAASSTSLISKQIVPARRVLCASPGYLDAAGEPTSPAELKDRRCLQYGYSGTLHSWRLAGPGGLQNWPINCVMYSNNGEPLKAAAIRHQGIALLPTFLVGEELQAGALQTVLPDYAPSELVVAAMYPRHRHLSAKVRLFVDLLETRFGARPYWDLVT